jgi:hypothetical protein
MLNRFAQNVGLTFIYIVAFYLITHGLMLINIIDDGIFAINRVFIGFYQWVYLLPLIIYLKKQRKSSSKGFIFGGLSISGLNIALIIWILLDPSKFI